MQAIDVEHVTKSYAGRAVVNDVSLSVEQGEIFGLIGPNGAGRTTTIRMMMDIMKPDSGQVRVLGENLNEATKSRLGYPPEERGLYKRLRVMETIVYLASLKGQSRSKAEERANELLSQTGMLANKAKKIDELERLSANVREAPWSFEDRAFTKESIILLSELGRASSGRPVMA